jgi:hypothetical protein
MRKPKMTPGHDRTDPAEAILKSPSIPRGYGHEHPIAVLKELHTYPISLLAAFADCGTILSGSRAVGGAHDETSDFDLYQLADREALINIVSVLNLDGIKWHNGFLNQIHKDMGEHELTMMPLDDIRRLEKRISGRYNSKLMISYLDRMLRQGKCNLKYSDLPKKFALALERCANNEREDNTIWVYDPKGPVQGCIRKLPTAITEPFSKLFSKLEDCSCGIDYELIKKWSPNAESIEEVKQAWRRAGYPEPMLRRWLRYKTIFLAPWLREAVGTILDEILYVDATKRQSTNSTDKESGAAFYDWFKMLRGTLRSKKRVQLMIVPPKKIEGRREFGIIGTLLNFHATHPMTWIGGTDGGHFYQDTARQGKSLMIDFTNDLRQKHAKDGIKKMKKRGWMFSNTGKDTRRRNALDGDTCLTNYKNLYMSAHEDMGKRNDALPAWFDGYFAIRQLAVETYSWLEKKGRITEVKNIAEKEYAPKDRLSEWVHDKLSGHEHVIPKDLWSERKFLAAELDLWFGGYRQELIEGTCYLL